jgi:hypothetical protein
MYKLKKEFLAEFNPFFYHYDKNEQSKVQFLKATRYDFIWPIYGMARNPAGHDYSTLLTRWNMASAVNSKLYYAML